MPSNNLRNNELEFYTNIWDSTRWVIVGEESLRNKVVELANQEQFRDMKTRFMSYGAVEELFSLCQRRRIRGVNDVFLDCFMESCIANG